MTALAILARFWRESIIAALLVACAVLIGYSARKADQLRTCQQIRLADQATWRAATEKARADDLAHAAAVEVRNDTISKEQANDLQAQLITARANAERFRLRAQSAANQSGVGHKDLSQAGDTASSTVGTGEAALIPISSDDLDICTINSVKAAAWLAWYERVSTSPQSAMP